MPGMPVLHAQKHKIRNIWIKRVLRVKNVGVSFSDLFQGLLRPLYCQMITSLKKTFPEHYETNSTEMRNVVPHQNTPTLFTTQRY